MPNKPFVPPGGFQGAAQQTVAVGAMLAKVVGRTRTPRKKTAKKKKKTGVRRVAKRRAPAKTATKGRLKKGSPEAKRRMAKLRKMRQKR